MEVVIAHGPWYTEWHHFLPWVIVTFPAIGAWIAVFKQSRIKKKEDNDG